MKVKDENKNQRCTTTKDRIFVQLTPKKRAINTQKSTKSCNYKFL